MAPETSHSRKIQDLSDRIAQLEAQLAQRDQENHALNNQIKVLERGLSVLKAGIFEWDITTQKFTISSSPCEPLSRRLDDTLPPPERLKELVSPEAYLIIQAKWLSLIRGRSEMEYGFFEVDVPELGCQKLRVYAFLLRNDAGEPEKVTGFLVLNQPGKWMPDFMEEFEVFDVLPVGIVYLDVRSGHLIEANRKAKQILQIDQSTTFTEDDPFNKIDWSEISDELADSHFIDKKELEIRLEDGTKKWILFSGNAGPGHTLYATIIDFTDIKSMISELQKVNFELDNFVYHASHDLRAPLRNVLGLLSLLKKGDSPVDRARSIELIEGSINRLDTLVVDLLSISRNNRGQQRFIKINFLVEVNNTVSSFYHMGNTRNLEIVTKVSQPVHYISDLTRIRIILNNLISNAIKYRRVNLDRSFINIEIWVDAQAAHIKVEDNGEGIAEEDIDLIYNMFFRASEKSEGSGLGLYIVKDVVDKLDGSIEVSSQKEVGTTFTVTLPNYTEPPQD